MKTSIVKYKLVAFLYFSAFIAGLIMTLGPVSKVASDAPWFGAANEVPNGASFESKIARTEENIKETYIQSSPELGYAINFFSDEEQELVTQTENYFQRRAINGVSEEESEAMRKRIQMAVANSPKMRTYFAERLKRAFEESNKSIVAELEPAFVISDEAYETILPIYKKVINKRLALDYHAISALSFAQSRLTVAEKQDFLDKSLAQLGRNASLDARATGPLGYIRVAAHDPNSVLSPGQRRSAIATVRTTLESATTAPVQFAAAAALFGLSSPTEATSLAKDLLSRQPNIAYLQATLSAVVSGRLPYDSSIILTAAKLFQEGKYQGYQAEIVLDYLDVLQKPVAGGS